MSFDNPDYNPNSTSPRKTMHRRMVSKSLPSMFDHTIGHTIDNTNTTTTTTTTTTTFENKRQNASTTSNHRRGSIGAPKVPPRPTSISISKHQSQMSLSSITQSSSNTSGTTSFGSNFTNPMNTSRETLEQYATRGVSRRQLDNAATKQPHGSGTS